MNKKILLSFNTISQYQKEIQSLNRRIAKEGETATTHGTTLIEWKKRYVAELLYAKELKRQGKFN